MKLVLVRGSEVELLRPAEGTWLEEAMVRSVGEMEAARYCVEEDY